MTNEEAKRCAVALHEFCVAMECFDCPFFSDEQFCCFTDYESTPAMWNLPAGWRGGKG